MTQLIPNLSPIARRFGLRLVVHFGSTATGRARADSDFDVAVWTSLPRHRGPEPVEGRRTSAWYGRLAAALEGACAPHRELDLVVLNDADSLLQFQVASTGRVLWAADPSVWPAFQSYAARRYDDDAKFRRAGRRWLEARYA